MIRKTVILASVLSMLSMLSFPAMAQQPVD